MSERAIKPRYQVVDGLRMPLGFPAAAIESGMTYRAGAGDIFVASYPKSGTTWLQYLVYLLVRKRAISPSETLAELFPHLEEVGADAASRQSRPRLIKTHLGFGRVPFHHGARYLVIVRNPFDCAVSFYYHTRGFPRHYDFADGSFADYFECFVRGEVDFGSYFEHLAGWHAERERDNVLFLTYEGLKAETERTIARIAGFLAGGAAIESQDLDYAALIEETSVDSMRRNQQRWSSRRPDWATGFVRKGVVGDWRNHFTAAMTARLLAECEQRLAGVSVDELWPGIFAAARSYAACAG